MPSSFYHHPNKGATSCDSLIMYSSKNPAASNNDITTPISIIVGLMSNFRLTCLKSTYAIWKLRDIDIEYATISIIPKGDK